MDWVVRPHLPAELTDDVGHSRTAMLWELVPYSLVDLFLRVDPAGVTGQIGQREELQVCKVNELPLPFYGLFA